MKINDKIINILKEYALKALKEEEIPVSAIIVDKNNNIVSIGYNNRQKKYSVLGHAEIEAIVKAEEIIKDWRLNGYKLFVTLEPCAMCSSIIKEARLDEIYYFLPRKKNTQDIIYINKKQIDGYDEVKKELNDLLTIFFNNKR